MKGQQSIRNLIALLALALSLAGCGPYLQAVQSEATQMIRISEGDRFGQTFVPVFNGLDGVQLFLEPGSTGQGELVFSLRTSPGAMENLASARMPVRGVDKPGFYNFNFPYINQSQNQYFYAILEIQGEGELGVQVGPAESYINGAAYKNHLPEEAQSKFRLSYQLLPLIAGLLSNILRWSWLAFSGSLVFVLPGWVIISLVAPMQGRLSWPEKFSLGAGVSLATFPLLMLWMDSIGVRLGVGYAWLAAGSGLVWMAMRGYRRLKNRGKEKSAPTGTVSDKQNGSLPWPTIAFVIVLAALLFSRFWVIRTLEAPMWGDSVQHTVMTQLLMDNGGLFNSWEPYTPYKSLTVQYGFPAAAAVFAWLNGMSSWNSALYTGQLINLLAVAALYPLAVRMSGNHWSGVAAVIIAGLFSPIPAIYVNWGRYAQLTGLAILPAALWLLWVSIDTPVGEKQSGHKKINFPVLILAGFVLAGMCLAYYRMAFFYVAFIPALLIGWGLPNWRLELRKWGEGFLKIALIGGAAGALSLPWLLRVMQGSVLAGLVESGVSNSTPLQNVIADYQVWRQISEFVPMGILVIAITGWVWSLVRRNWIVAGIGLWTLSLASLVALSLLRIPGANLMQNFAVVISLYVPVAVVSGWLIGEIARSRLLRSPVSQTSIVVLVACVAAWGVLSQRNLAQPEIFAMVTRPDMRAMEWIRENTPPDSVFLVEGFRVYSYSAVGSDAGWWLPLLAGRKNTIPPQYALMNEAPENQGYSQNVTLLIKQLEEDKPASDASLALLCQWEITHIYIGQGQGKVSIDNPQLFSPADFANNPYFNPVYRNDRVHIYALDQGACEGRAH